METGLKIENESLRGKEETISEFAYLMGGTTGASIGVLLWITTFFVTYTIVDGKLNLSWFFGLLLTIPVCVLSGFFTGSIIAKILGQKDDGI